MPERRVCLGAIAGAHGVRGAVRVKSFTEAPEDVAAYGPLEDEAGARRFTLEVTGAAKGAVICRIEGVDTREAAEALKGLRLYVPRERLPEPAADEFYHADLLGLEVRLDSGAVLGRISAVHAFGGADVIEIAREGAEDVMIPFTCANVPEVDLAAGRVVVVPPEGLLGEGEGAGAEGAGERRARARTVPEGGADGG